MNTISGLHRWKSAAQRHVVGEHRLCSPTPAPAVRFHVAVITYFRSCMLQHSAEVLLGTSARGVPKTLKDRRFASLKIYEHWIYPLLLSYSFDLTEKQFHLRQTHPYKIFLPLL